MICRILIIVLFVISSSRADCQHETTKSYLKSYLTNTKSVITSPSRWKANQIIAVTTITAGTVGLIGWGDKPIQDFFHRNENAFINNSSHYFFSPLGNGVISIPVLGIFYAYGAISDDARAMETGLKGLEAFFITAVLTGVIKQIAHRHRPYQNDIPNPNSWDGPFDWGGSSGLFRYNSFPSGHSSTIFAIATVVSLEYRETKWVPIVSFGLAGLTALYRLGVNDHWASDVLAGSALGFAIGSLVYNNRSSQKLMIIPVSQSGIGATIVYHF